jgi:translation initiation factor 5B
MAPKKNNKNKNKAKATTPVNSNEDDWESTLNEFSEKVKVEEAVEETSTEQVTPPPAPEKEEVQEVDAAAAFLASMGVSKSTEDGAEDSGKKDKKKKKGKKKESGNNEEGDGGGGGGGKDAPKKPQSAAARLAAARLAAAQEEEERIRLAQEAEDARIAAEEKAEAEATAKAEEEKRLKKEKAAAKIEAAKKAGTYRTKAQKEKDKIAAARLEAMKAAGMIGDIDTTAAKAKRPVYDNKKKKNNKNNNKSKAEEPVKDEPAKEPSKEEQSEETPAPELKLSESWEDAALDDWEDASLDVLPTINLNVEEDLAAKEKREEEEKLIALAEARRLKKLQEDADTNKSPSKSSDSNNQTTPKAAEEKETTGDEKKGMDVIEVSTENMSKAELEAYEKKMLFRKKRKEREAENEKLRSVDKLRCPIVCIMGHVDTGKTKLLDKIRRTNVQDGEAGGITQQIGATYFPENILSDKTNKLNKLINLKLKLPGMLVIDTPGHEAFANLRNRGSSICDIAILVIDLMHGLEPQTIESIDMLRRKKCPFVVALNKVDRCYDWVECKDMEFRDALSQQSQATREEFLHRTQNVRTQLMEKGMNAELYWENKELASTVSLVPTSAITGEGINDLLHMLTRLSQTHLANKLSYSLNMQCTVLEVKVIEGLGCTLDVILVNGVIENGCTIVVCTTEGPVVTQVRALLTPPPNRELRVKSNYVHHDKLNGAVGIKICAPGLENAVAGSTIMVLSDDDDVEDLKDEVMADFATLAKGLATDSEGVLAVASTLGALEALLVFLRSECNPPIPVVAVSIGPIYKKDVMRAALMHQRGKPEFATILAFDVPIDPDALTYANENKVKIFTADIIYHLFDQFIAHRSKTNEEEKAKAIDVAVFPCLLNILPNAVFNQKDPIILGVEVTDGILKVGTPLCIPKNGFLKVGRVASIEMNNTKVERVRKGSQCAVSIVNDSNPQMTFGRQFNAENALYSELSRSSIDALKKYFKDEMTNEDWKLVIKMKKVFSII